MTTTPTKQEISLSSALALYEIRISNDEEVLESEEEYGEEEKGEDEESLSSCWGILKERDPRSEARGRFRGNQMASWIGQERNRIFLFLCTIDLFVDPLFFYVLAISEAYLCVFVDGWFAITVTMLRCSSDALHLWNVWLQLKLPIHYPYGESKVQASNKGTTALTYLKSKEGFFLDLFVILPLPQIILWVAIPYLLRKGLTNEVMRVMLLAFVLQYPAKIYRCGCLLRRLRKFSIYIFGSAIWWGVALNIIAYSIASHAAGACWYLLGIERATNCLIEQCSEMQGCAPKVLASQQPIYYGTTSTPVKDHDRLLWASNRSARSNCLESSDNYDYGAYEWIIYLVSNNNRLEKILMPVFWGLMTLSTFGNLESTTDWVESLFVIIVLTCGLVLVTMLIGNIKVFMHSTTSKKQAMQLRMRNIEWWMQKRKLPPALKQRVRNYEWKRWAAMRGVDECEMIHNLPEGLRRDIKYHLCLDLVKQVPLFQHMDDLVLENICDRVKSLIFTKGETIVREGDPVQRMLFIVRGHIQSIQVLRDSVKSSCMLGPGNFSGDELLSWCLKRPFVERLPPSSSTLVTLETMEAFGLEAEDVKYVTQHFRYTFINEKVKRSARYYSLGWRTWAAVAIQLAWRRHKQQLDLKSLSLIRPRRPLSRTSSSLGEDRLRLFTAILTSPKPSQDEFIDL